MDRVREREILRLEDDVPYTTDNNIDAIKATDKVVEVVGYITDVSSPKVVGANQHRLMKFIISNNSHRLVQVLLWNNLIYDYEQAIVPNRRIHIDGATAKAASTTFKRNDIILYPIELSIQESTVVSFGGYHQDVDYVAEDPQPIEFLELEHANGLVQVDAYVKTVFVNIGRTRAARGSIAHFGKKVNVRIADFDAPPNMVKEMLIRIIGTVQTEDGLVSLHIRSNNDILLLNEMGNVNEITGMNEMIVRQVPI